MNPAGPDRNIKETTEAGRIAKFYGFCPILPPHLNKQDYDLTKIFDDSLCPAEKAALLRMYFDERLYSQPQPNMFYCERPFCGSKDGRKNPYKLEACLVSLGSFKSVCECLSMQTGIAILNSLGHKNLEIEVNSIGDKESISEFQKKLSSFVRKNINSFSAELRQALKKDIFAIFKGFEEERASFADIPRPLDFLSEQSRLHFKEVLEFLEVMSIPYSINNFLIGDIEIGSETVYSIKEASDSPEEEKQAFGFRFNRLAKKLGYKKELPAAILNIGARLKKKSKKVKMKTVQPQFFLVQFGPEAKLKSFIILDELRKAGATVVHSIAKDKLGSQMGVAENYGAPYILLIGQKEALENSVVIRNTSTRAQEIVPLAEFASRIKELAFTLLILFGIS